MTESSKSTPDDGSAEFIEWFAQNYPGPNTIINDPRWHAPKIWRVAMRLRGEPIKSTLAPQASDEVAWLVEYDGLFLSSLGAANCAENIQYLSIQKKLRR